MEFINRTKEINYLRSYFSHTPSSLMVVYGPKSTGKTTLLNHYAQNFLTEKQYAVNLINLRGVMIHDFQSFLDVFFQKSTKDKMRGVLSGFTINTGFFRVGIEDEALLKKNPFKVMENQLQKVVQKGIRPIIIIDELQSLKGIYMNGGRRLLEELLNFFVRLTKETHLAHIVLASSDSFFIDELHQNAKLLKTSQFMEVGQLQKSSVLIWLSEKGFSEEAIDFVWEHTKGNPWEIEQLIQAHKSQMSLEDAFDNLLIDAYAQLDRYIVFDLSTTERRSFFQQVNQQIVAKGKCPTHQLPKPVFTDIIQAMVDKDIWFYNSRAGYIAANSESVRRAIAKKMKEFDSDL